MIKSGKLRVHYGEIPERIRVFFGDRVGDQHDLDTWDFDLRNQTCCTVTRRATTSSPTRACRVLRGHQIRRRVGVLGSRVRRDLLRGR